MSVNLEIFNAYNNGLVTGVFQLFLRLWQMISSGTSQVSIVIPVQLLEKKHLEHTWLNFQKKQTVPSKY